MRTYHNSQKFGCSKFFVSRKMMKFFCMQIFFTRLSNCIIRWIYINIANMVTEFLAVTQSPYSGTFGLKVGHSCKLDKIAIEWSSLAANWCQIAVKKRDKVKKSGTAANLGPKNRDSPSKGRTVGRYNNNDLNTSNKRPYLPSHWKYMFMSSLCK